MQLKSHWETISAQRQAKGCDNQSAVLSMHCTIPNKRLKYLERLSLKPDDIDTLAPEKTADFATNLGILGTN